MSDDEDILYVKKTNTIHYGSLEEGEKAKQTLEEIESDEEDFTAEPEAKKPAIVKEPAGNIHISNEYLNLEAEV